MLKRYRDHGAMHCPSSLDHVEKPRTACAGVQLKLKKNATIPVREEAERRAARPRNGSASHGAPRPGIEPGDMLALTGKVALIINYHAFGHDDILDGATVPSISSRTNAAN
jgi:hypothetical protein